MKIFSSNDPDAIIVSDGDQDKVVIFDVWYTHFPLINGIHVFLSYTYKKQSDYY